MLDAIVLAFLCIIVGFYLSSKLLWIAKKALHRELKSANRSVSKLLLWLALLLLAFLLVFLGLKFFVWDTISMYQPSDTTGFTWLDTVKAVLEHLLALSLPFLVETVIRFFWEKVSRKS